MTEFNYRDIVQIESKLGEPPISEAGIYTILNFMHASGEAVGLLKKILFTGKPIDEAKLRRAVNEIFNTLSELEHLMRRAKTGKRILVDDFGAELFTVNRRLLHAVMGKFDEIGELADALSKQCESGTLDVKNFKAELGDDRWYTELAYDEIGTTNDDTERLNWAKLMDKKNGRYKDGFSVAASENRDTAAEQVAMDAVK